MALIKSSHYSSFIDEHYAPKNVASTLFTEELSNAHDNNNANAMFLWPVYCTNCIIAGYTVLVQMLSTDASDYSVLTG